MLRRALALASVAARAGLEARAGEPEAVARHARMLDWLRGSGLAPSLEPGESALVAAPLGTLDEAALVDASWRAEGAYVLAWALDLHPLLAHDRAVDPDDIAWPLGFLDESALKAAARPELRGEREIDLFLARQLAVHWRLREQALRPGPLDFAAVVATGDWAPLDIDESALADGDLAIDGAPIDQAAGEALARCTSMAAERHRAANWLVGADPIYSSVENYT